MSERKYFRFNVDGLEMHACGECSAFVVITDHHDAWHDNLFHSLNALSTDTQRVVDFVAGKPPRAPYRRPQTPEEREQTETILRGMGIQE